jgi:dihydrofolate reductase
MVCLHGMDPATVYLSAWARVDGMTVGDLDRVLYVDRSLVKHLAMRRTPQLFELPKVVFSTTLEKVEGNARLARAGIAQEVARLKHVAVGGAGLAAAFIDLALVDEYRLFVSPVVLGAGTRYFPALEQRVDLELVETRTFGSRVVYIRYLRA